jgi:leucine dehydrogenase
MGGIINDDTINRLKCQVIAGAANNQLEDEKKHGDLLIQKGIVYAPDFVINAGGLINVYSEYTGYIREIAMSQTEMIYQSILDIFRTADEQKINNQFAAIAVAEKRINDMKGVHATY